MPNPSRFRRWRRVMLWTAGTLTVLFLGLILFVNRMMEPLLRDRLHTLIIQGSDSLYVYTLGDLKANFYGGDVEIVDLNIRVDSARYEYLRSRNALPPLTMNLTLGHGHVYGVGIIDLLFGKKVIVREIMSKDANLKLSRHVRPDDSEPRTNIPLWKAIEPKIKSIDIKRIRLEQVKMNYKNADTSESLKLEFEGCNALIRDIRIDSASNTDTSRIGFAKSIQLQIEEVKYRNQDSSYKLKIDTVDYSSTEKLLRLKNFKWQPTLEKEQFYALRTVQEPMYIVKFDQIFLRNFRLDHFIRNNLIDPGSALLDSADVTIYNDRNLLSNVKSKIGAYPHQKLLGADVRVSLKKLDVTNGRIRFTERAPENGEEGSFELSNLNISATKLTNIPAEIRKDAVMKAAVKANLFGSSPLAVDFRFYLDSANGRFDASGEVSRVNAEQLNALAKPLANVQINAFNIDWLRFQVRGEDYTSYTDAQMRYHGLSVTFRKIDEETGALKTKKFMTKLVNRYILWDSNPGPDGVLRTAQNHRLSRLTTQSFFGFLWKSIFAGMQDILMKQGRYG